MKKIICVDNFDRKISDDILVADNVEDNYSEIIANFLNRLYLGDDSQNYFISVELDCKLFKREY
ncbi:MAG: hypothetical protein GQ540_03175 [Lutibacter sp.]|uniref:hypothetical protein n=1 Tax=Lutibacter sp. TaxID=1925666 RepID=UPI0019FC37DB|nr:hypothetical protein [Lutibacter sp.]NOR27513.1 hypothetical protein [Lutibacter sp.]